MARTVVIGLLGSTMDRAEESERWARWRPTVSLFQHEDLLVHRLELLCGGEAPNVARQVVADIRAVSPETEIRVHDLAFRDPWDFENVYGVLHDFARAYPFDVENESYLVHITTGTHVAQICLFLLTESRRVPGRLIQTSPPRKAHSGEIARYNIIDLDLSRYDRLAERFADERRDALDFLKSGIPTRNAAFNATMAQIEHVAIHSTAPLLLMGPTGAGKSSLGRRIYELKKQRRQLAGRLVEVNCATLRGEGAMSALFGHKKGAFTGATQDRAGHLREADGGLLFLDEIGELGLDEQAMLLGAIEEKRFFPLGADRAVASDFQLVCGTNRDLGAAVRAGLFREDLLARIYLWTFDLPGLTRRREDIEPNVRYELAQLTSATGRSYHFNREALSAFLDFAGDSASSWMGNFRDLNAALARMATMAPSGRITRPVVDAEIERLRRAWRLLECPPNTDPDEVDLEGLLGKKLAEIDEFDRVQLAHVVGVCRSARTLSAAGRRLFAASRAKRTAPNDADRLRKYLARFGLTWEKLQSASAPPARTA